jgi:hypothetical protein
MNTHFCHTDVGTMGITLKFVLKEAGCDVWHWIDSDQHWVPLQTLLYTEIKLLVP